MKKLISLLLAVLFAFSIATVSVAEGDVFTGLVTANNGTTFSVTNSFGSVLTFARGAGLAAIPEIGSTVAVDFSGDITTQLVAESVTVENAAVKKTATGIVRSVSSNMIVIETPNSVLLTIYYAENTAFSGVEKALAVGQTVNVVYSESVQFVSVVDIAISIEITAAAKKDNGTVKVVVDDKPTEKDTTNKKLSGTVTKLSDSKVTIKTSKGKTWSFRLNKYTAYSGKYDFEVGCTVTVTYDGYASEMPAAKKIKITKEASHDPVTHKKTGICDFFEGMAIGLTNGFSADVAYAKHIGGGEREPGTKVTVWYYTENGRNYATKIKWFAN